MTRILLIGSSDALAVELARLGLDVIGSAQDFRAFADGMAGAATAMELCALPDLPDPRGAPPFGSPRPYLKRKKGRS